MGRPDYILGQFGSKVIFLLSPAIAQTTGVNKSVSFARWQQGAGFVVPRTTACYLFSLDSVYIGVSRVTSGDMGSEVADCDPQNVWNPRKKC